MVALDISGKLALSFLIAIAQFFEPLPEADLAALEQSRTLTEAERALYTFQPKSGQDLKALTNKELAAYLRTACVRFRNEAILTEDSFKSGRLVELSTLDFIANTIDMSTLGELQEGLLPEEKFDPQSGLRVLIKTCEDKDPRFPLEVLEQYNLQEAVDFYLSFEGQLPRWTSASEMPPLPEMYTAKDATGQPVSDLFSVETLRINGEVQVVRRNRRINADRGEIPLTMFHAIVAIEDAQFWNFQAEGTPEYRGHGGFDPRGALRAGKTTASGDGVQGGSTITMQLVKNYILYEDVNREYSLGKRSLHRKLNEMILSSHLENLLTKEQILVMYLNTIDFGRDTQGIKMAARAYFDKEPQDLELHEVATLAALPKGPSYYNPDRYPDRLRTRRNHVLKRMNQEGYITAAQMNAAQAEPLGIVPRKSSASERNPYAGYYISELMNRIYSNKIAPEANEQNEIVIPMKPDLQALAVQSLQKQLIEFDKEKGRLTARVEGDGLPNLKARALIKINQGKDPVTAYSEVLNSLEPIYPELAHFERTVLIGDGRLVLANGEALTPSQSHRNWMKRKKNDGSREDLVEGDIVFIDRNPESGSYKMVGFPEITGAIIVLENTTGNVLATAGGFSLGPNQRYLGPSSNNAFHAFRQPGSTLKPFLYLKALAQGVAPSTNIANTPISFPERYRDGQRHCNRWSPASYSSGERTQVDLANALTYSRNLASGHLLNLLSGDNRSLYPSEYLYLPNPTGSLRGFSPLAQTLDELWDYFMRFGLYPNMPGIGPCYSSILGAEEVTVARLAGAYQALANGGVRMKPRLYTERGSTGYSEINMQLDPIALFQLRNMLQSVVRSGTASRISRLSDRVAGKTGTTNNNQDAWFAGFTPEITVVVWVGYPDNTRLGSGGTGGKVALPVFESFLQGYYDLYPESAGKKLSETPAIPDGWREIRIEPRSGLMLDEDFVREFQRLSGQSNLPPTELEYVSPAQYQNFANRLAFDPENREFWKLAFDYMTPRMKDRIQRSFDRTYRQMLRDVRRAQERCNRTQNYNDCKIVDDLLRQIPTLFDFYYYNRDYFTN